MEAIGIELVIVILGVFIGTQVSNWNGSRHEEARAQEALARIQADLRTIGLRSVFWPKVNEYGRQAIHYAETGELVQGSAWKTVLAFYQASQLWPWVPSDATYQELRSNPGCGEGEPMILRYIADALQGRAAP